MSDKSWGPGMFWKTWKTFFHSLIQSVSTCWTTFVFMSMLKSRCSLPKIAKAHLSRFKHFVSTFFHSLVYHCRGYSLWVGSLSNTTWKQKLFSILNVFKFFKFSGFQVFKILSFSSFSKHFWFPAFVWHSEFFFKDLGTAVHRWPFVIWIYLCCCFILVHLIHDLQMQCLIHKYIQLPGFF